MSLRDKITQSNNTFSEFASSKIIGLKFSIYINSFFFFLDVEKQLGVEKDSLGTLRKQIEEAQKQSGRFVS